MLDDESDDPITGESGEFQDNSEKQTYDNPHKRATEDPLGNEDKTPDTNEQPSDSGDGRFTKESPVDVDWEELVGESDVEINGDLNEITGKKIKRCNIQDDASVAIHLIADATGKDPDEVVSDFVEPIIVDQAVKHLQGTELDA